MFDAVKGYLKRTFPTNVGKSERTIRIVCGVVLIAASFMEFADQDQEFWFVLVGWFGLMSGVISHCPIYGLFGMNTAENE